jgi:sporulation protein YlmC with PRC-barrel domain
VRTSDGHDAGRVHRAVVQPNTNEVTEFIISTGGLLGHDVVVPRDELEGAAKEGDALRLRLSKQQLARLPEYHARDYVPPPPGWTAPNPDSYLFPAGSFAFPADYGVNVEPSGFGANPATVGTPVEPGHEEPTLTRGSVVLDRDGDDIGVVDDLRVKAEGGTLDSVIVRLGNAFVTFFGAGEKVEIPITLVERVAEQAVSLRVTKDELKRRLRA